MLYQIYQAHSDIMVPVRSWASEALNALGAWPEGMPPNIASSNLTAAYELLAPGEAPPPAGEQS